MMFVGSCVYSEKHLLARILNSKIFSRVGEVSYGMYLFQIFCLYLVRSFFQFVNWENPYFELFAAIVLIFLVASVSYFRYESRFLAMKKLFQPHF